MIEVKRIPGDVPEVLNKPYRDDRTELDRARAHYIEDGKSGSYEFDRYRSAEVKAELDRIFHGKCAYCESFYAKTQPVDVEHYRPKGKVDDAGDHRGYWWLAMDWENLVPSCIDCNRKRWQKTPDAVQQNSMTALNAHGDFARGEELKTGKQSAFPLASGSPRAKWDTVEKDTDLSREKRLLLDPTRDIPEEHLVFQVDRADAAQLISIVYPMPLTPQDALVLPALGDPAQIATQAGAVHVSAIGAVSIQVYGLNRLSPVQARTKVLRDLEFLLEMSISLTSLSTEIDARIAARVARIDAASGVAKTQLQDDQALDQRISAKMGELVDKVMAQMISFTEPEAQFSALSKAWMARFVDA